MEVAAVVDMIFARYADGMILPQVTHAVAAQA